MQRSARVGIGLIARVIYVGVIALTVASYFWDGWMGWAVYVVILTFMLRVGHPRVMDEYEPLGFSQTNRDDYRLAGIFALFYACADYVLIT